MTVLLAKYFTVYFLVLGVSMYMYPKWYEGALKSLIDKPYLQVLDGYIPLILGTFLVLLHGTFYSDIKLAVTIMAYLHLIGGLIRIILHDIWIAVLKAILSTVSFKSMSILFTIIGLFYGYIVYVIG